LPSVLYVVNDKLGGVVSLNANLARFRRPDDFASHDFLLLHNQLDDAARWARSMGGDGEELFEYALPVENVYAVLRRLRAQVPNDGGGVLVANDWLELALATVYPLDRAVVQIVHDDYHFGLALRHENVIDAFIAHNRTIFARLCEELPARTDSIHYLPYGIPLPEKVTERRCEPLRLLFIGRMTPNKGIFDLPEIDRLVVEAGVAARWTLVGDGPHKGELLDRFPPSDRVHYVAPEKNEEVLALAAEHDVFVLPTRFEGFPVSLLETMGTGLVPVVTRLPGGITEVVVENETGYHPEPGDTGGFAKAIVELASDRARLEAMGRASRDLVCKGFDIRERVKGYQELFGRWRELRRGHPPGLKLPYGSRLDKPWIPNVVVRLVRANVRRRRVASASA